MHNNPSCFLNIFHLGNLRHDSWKDSWKDLCNICNPIYVSLILSYIFSLRMISSGALLAFLHPTPNYLLIQMHSINFNAITIRFNLTRSPCGLKQTHLLYFGSVNWKNLYNARSSPPEVFL